MKYVGASNSVNYTVFDSAVNNDPFFWAKGIREKKRIRDSILTTGSMDGTINFVGLKFLAKLTYNLSVTLIRAKSHHKSNTPLFESRTLTKYEKKKNNNHNNATVPRICRRLMVNEGLIL